MSPVSAEMARQVAEIFTEVILAPSYDEDALDILSTKKNLRATRWPQRRPLTRRRSSRPVSGGLLIQTSDRLDAAGDNPATGTWRPARRPTTRPLAISCSPGVQCGR